MSQFIVFNATGGGGGGPLNTLTGNAGGTVAPVAGNINILMPAPYVDGLAANIYGQGEVIGNGSPATLNVNPYISSGIQTVDATADVPLYILNIRSSSSLTYFAIMNGVHADYGEAITTFASGGVVRAAAGAPQEIGTTVINPDKTGGFVGDIDVIIVGDALQFVVTGEDTTIINWTALIYFVWQ